MASETQQSLTKIHHIFIEITSIGKRKTEILFPELTQAVLNRNIFLQRPKGVVFERLDWTIQRIQISKVKYLIVTILKVPRLD